MLHHANIDRNGQYIQFASNLDFVTSSSDYVINTTRARIPPYFLAEYIWVIIVKLLIAWNEPKEHASKVSEHIYVS